MAPADPAESAPIENGTKDKASSETLENPTAGPKPNPTAAKTTERKLPIIPSQKPAESPKSDSLESKTIEDAAVGNQKSSSTTDGVADGMQPSPPPPPEPSPDIYIALMGQTGTGKTSFIRDATRRKDLKVGHYLESCTQHVEVIETTIGDRTVKLIDTPGFDDSGRSDADILETISDYLRAAYTQKINLTGVIYVQRITDNRMQGSSLRCLRLLKKLCGPEYYGNIVLVTTMWGNITQKEGEERENNLRNVDAYWGELLRQGATFQRHFPRGNASALRVITHLLEKTPAVLNFQRELFKAHGVIADTSAGQVLMLFYATKLEETQKKINKVQKELDESQAVMNKAKEELEKSRKEREALEEQVKRERESLQAQLKKERESLEADVKKERETLEAAMTKEREALETMMKIEKEDRISLEKKMKKGEEEAETFKAEIQKLRDEIEANSGQVKKMKVALEEKSRGIKSMLACPVQ